ncbi:MAG: TrkH family potassium uptake protein [Prevotella sp.]|nr:TrkH family potassium uptake protein [Prevotella sp.]
MINGRLIYKVLGSLLLLEAVFMSWCVIMAFCYGEKDAIPFLISTVITTAAGIFLKYRGKDATNDMNRRDAYLVVTLTWLVFSIFGSIPYMLSGILVNPTDAFFETMSGFTTTGASVINDVEHSLSHSILFWRSLSQWVGGLGIVFFTIAVLPSMVGGSMKVFSAEATGPMRAKMHPRLSTNAKWIWTVYLVLTIACCLAFFFGGMDWFSSINYAMTTTATGGFSIHNDSIGHFNSPLIEYIGILFQFLAGINFTVIYMSIFKGKIKQLLRNSEVKFYCLLLLIATVWIGLLLLTRNGYDVEHAFRSSLFQVVSFITTTGIFCDDVGLWPHLTWLILAIVMFIGACAGSTSGGFKSVRALMILRVLQNELRRILHPRAVLPVKINGQSIPAAQINNLLAFLALYVMACFATAALMTGIGLDSANSMVIALSCISNVGLPLDVIGPDFTWGALPALVKWICSVLMLMGRLEIFSVIVLFTRSFWKDN